MGSSHSINMREDELIRLQDDTGFTRSQISRLYNRFKHLDRNVDGYLSKEDFLQIEELRKNPLCDRIINLFFTTDTNQDPSEPTNLCDFRQFVRTLARFRPVQPKKQTFLNSRTDKLKFAFNMYDLNADNKITQDEVYNVVKLMVGSNINDEQLTSIADRIILEANESHDGTVSFEEFQKVLHKVDVEQKMSIRFKN